MWRWLGEYVKMFDELLSVDLSTWRITSRLDSAREFALRILKSGAGWLFSRCISISVPFAAWSEDFLQSRNIIHGHLCGSGLSTRMKIRKFWNKIIAGYEKRPIFQPKLVRVVLIRPNESRLRTYTAGSPIQWEFNTHTSRSHSHDARRRGTG